jgi:polysaccharide biosynthesis/export protein
MCKRFSAGVRVTLFGVICAAIASASLSAQSAATPSVAASDRAAATAVPLPADYVIGPEDVLGVVFWRDQEMTSDVTVRPDGMVTLPLLGDLAAAGLTPEALRDQIQKAATKYMQDPNVTILVKQINSRKVFITGEVTTPGAYPLTGPRTVMQLIAVAGGLTEFADGKNITVMRAEEGRTRSFKFNYKDVAKGVKLDQNIQLKPGDTVVVP